METKRNKVIQALESQNYIEALKITKGFVRDLTKEERAIVTRAYEMQWNETFYRALGYNKEEEFEKAVKILKGIYLK